MGVGTANAAIAAALGVLSFFRARRSGALFWYLLTGFFGCLLMSGMYYTLTTFLLEYPYIISPGDLSWVGAIVFLIIAAIDTTDKWTAEQKRAAEKLRLPALATSAVCAAFNALFIAIYPEITANYSNLIIH